MANFKTLTKKQVVASFKAENAAFIRKCCTMPTDFPALRQAWNDYCDTLRKDGMININADWTQPAFIKNPTVLK